MQGHLDRDGWVRSFNVDLADGSIRDQRLDWQEAYFFMLFRGHLKIRTLVRYWAAKFPPNMHHNCVLGHVPDHHPFTNFIGLYYKQHPTSKFLEGFHHSFPLTLVLLRPGPTAPLPSKNEKWPRVMTTTEAVRSATRRASNLFRRNIAEEMRIIPGMLISSCCIGSFSIERTSFRSRRASSGQRASRHRQTLSYCFRWWRHLRSGHADAPQSWKQSTRKSLWCI